ncbi:MAG: hypothetical protein M1815_005171 [Lichina confinis]|nr:MAG: hypothetical protein M1815_005171 [Lichina confinis]
MRLAVGIVALWVLFSSAAAAAAAAASPLGLPNAAPTKELSRRSPPQDRPRRFRVSRERSRRYPRDGSINARNSRDWKVVINWPYGHQRTLYRSCLNFWDYLKQDPDASFKLDYPDFEQECHRNYPVRAHHRLLSEKAAASADPVSSEEEKEEEEYKGLSPDPRQENTEGDDEPEPGNGLRLFRSRRQPSPADSERRAGLPVPSTNDIMAYLKETVSGYFDPKQDRPASVPSGSSGILTMVST